MIILLYGYFFFGMREKLEDVMTAAEVKRLLKAQADPEKAAFFPNFFKTGPGEYGEGDRFHGVTVPKCRKIAKTA